MEKQLKEMIEPMFAKKSKLQEIVDTVTPHVEAARDAAAPHVDSARDKFLNEVIPAIQSAAQEAADSAREQAGPAAAEAKRRGLAATAALKGEQPAKKGGKMKKLLLLTGLAGLAAFAAKKLSGGADEQAWESSYTPKHTQPVPAAAAGTESDDAGGGTPGEVLSDNQDAPQPPSTPDSPAEVTEVDEQPDADRL